MPSKPRSLPQLLSPSNPSGKDQPVWGLAACPLLRSRLGKTGLCPQPAPFPEPALPAGWDSREQKSGALGGERAGSPARVKSRPMNHIQHCSSSRGILWGCPSSLWRCGHHRGPSLPCSGDRVAQRSASWSHTPKVNMQLRERSGTGLLP